MELPKKTSTPNSIGANHTATKSGNYCPAAGDLIWYELNPPRGHEQADRRPALVLSPRPYNQASGLCLACPVTNRAKGYSFEVSMPAGHTVLGVVLADQLRAMSWRERRAEFITSTPEEVLDEVRAKLAVLIGL